MLGLMVMDQISSLILTGVSYQVIFLIRDVILIKTKDLKVSVLPNCRFIRKTN